MPPSFNMLNPRQLPATPAPAPGPDPEPIPLVDRPWFLALVVAGGVLILLASLIMGFFLHRSQARHAHAQAAALARQNSIHMYHQSSSVMSSSPTISMKPYALPPPPPPPYIPPSTMRDGDLVFPQQQQHQLGHCHRRSRSRNFSLSSRKAPSDVERVVREQEAQRQQMLQKARQEAAQRQQQLELELQQEQLRQEQLQNEQLQQAQLQQAQFQQAQFQQEQLERQQQPLHIIPPNLHDHPALAGSPVTELSSARDSNQSLSSELKALEAGIAAIPHSPLPAAIAVPVSAPQSSGPLVSTAQSLSATHNQPEDSFHPSLIPSTLNLLLQPTRDSTSSEAAAAPTSPPLPRRSSRRRVSPTVPVFPGTASPSVISPPPPTATAPRHSRSVESFTVYRTHPRAATHQPDRSRSVDAVAAGITRSRSLRDLHLQHMRSQSSKLPPGGWQLQVSTLDTTGTRPVAVPEDEAVASFAPNPADVSALDHDDDSDSDADHEYIEVSMLSDAVESPVLPRKSSQRASGASSLYIAALTNGGTLPQSFKRTPSEVSQQQPPSRLSKHHRPSAIAIGLARSNTAPASPRRFPAVEPEASDLPMLSYRPAMRAPMSLRIKSEAAAKRRDEMARRAAEAASKSRLSYMATAQRWSDELCGSRLDGPMGDMMPAR